MTRPQQHGPTQVAHITPFDDVHHSNTNSLTGQIKNQACRGGVGIDFSIGAVEGCAPVSIDTDHDFAFCTSGLDAGQCLRGLLKGKDLVDDWSNGARLDDAGDLTQLRAIWLHEQKRKVDTAMLGPSPHTCTQPADDPLELNGCPDVLCK